MKNDLSKKFQTIYNKIDEYLRNQLKVGKNVSHSHLIKEVSKSNSLIRNNKDILIQFAQLRNAIVHNSNRDKAHPIAEPHPSIVNQYETILGNIMNPIKALSIAVKIDLIFSASMQDNALEVINVMNEKQFTHVPIINNGVIEGVFSENVIFSFLAKNEIIMVEKNSTMNEFSDFLHVENHSGEYFEFISRETLLVDIENMANNQINGNKRLGAIFITHNASKKEKCLGMLTAWDLINV